MSYRLPEKGWGSRPNIEEEPIGLPPEIAQQNMQRQLDEALARLRHNHPTSPQGTQLALKINQ